MIPRLGHRTHQLEVVAVGIGQRGDPARILAHLVQEPYQMGEDPGWIATLSDPDDNYFQLMSPMS